MATQENIEYLALLKFKVELTSEISADPLSLATALVAKGLIPESVHTSMLIPTKENNVKASELVSQVTNKVKTFPATFDEFLKILGDFIWLKNILELITKVYGELKLKDRKRNDTEDVTPTSSEGKCLESRQVYTQIYTLLMWEGGARSQVRIINLP